MVEAACYVRVRACHVAGGVIDTLDLEATAAWGLLFGLVHWMVAGMAMGMMPIMHPRIRSGQMSAPGVLVDGEVVVGFDKSYLESLLA